MLFIAAAFLWQFGDERQAARHKTVGQTSSNPATKQKVVPPPALPSNNSSAVRRKDTNFPYRVGNTAQSPNQLARNEKAILLRNALIETADGADSIGMGIP